MTNEIYIPAIECGRQLSRARCWASVASAIGNNANPDKKLSAADLIVAERIDPDLRAGDGAAKAMINNALERIPQGERSKFAPEPRAQNPEPRNVADMIKKHFGFECASHKVDGSLTEVAWLIRETLGRKIPLILVLRPVAKLKRLSDGSSYDFKHVILCHGAENLDNTSFTLLLQDPARPLGTHIKYKIHEILYGVPYISASQFGPKFLEEFQVEQVSMKLCNIMFVDSMLDRA